MNVQRFIKNVNNADWQKYDDAKYFQYRHDGISSFAKTVPQALINLALVDKESDELLDIRLLERIGKVRADIISNAPIRSNLMFAIGNDHAGVYYPVAREALPFIIEVAIDGNHLVSRTCAIDGLIDLYYFGPEDDSGDLCRFVQGNIENTIVVYRENFASFFASDVRNEGLMNSLFAIA